jgi:hypothetical protein
MKATPLAAAGPGHARGRSEAGERLIDQDMLASCDRRERGPFLRDGRDGDVDGTNVRAGQQGLNALDYQSGPAVGNEGLSVLDPAARHGGQSGALRFGDRIGDDAGDHARSDYAKSKMGHFHRSFPLARRRSRPRHFFGASRHFSADTASRLG